MPDYEYCELWWSDGYRPQLTFYKPQGAENITVGKDKAAENDDAWETLQRIVAELGFNGWELISASHHSAGLLFKRHLR